MLQMFYVDYYVWLSIQFQLTLAGIFEFFIYNLFINPSKFIIINIVGFNIDCFVYGFFDNFVRAFLAQTGLIDSVDVSRGSSYAKFMESLDDFMHAVALDVYEIAAPDRSTFTLNASFSSPLSDFILDSLGIDKNFTQISEETKKILWIIPVTITNIFYLVIFVYGWVFCFSFVFLFVGVSMYGDAYLIPTPSDIVEVAAADEEEVGALDDIIFLLLIILCSALWFMLICFFYYAKPMLVLITIFSVYPWVILAVYAAPINSFIDYGLGFPAYLRGSVNTSFMSFEAMFDCIAVCTALTRLTAQQIRILFVFVAYSEIEHFVYTNSLATEDPYTFLTVYYTNIADQNDLWDAAYYLVVDFPLFVFNTIYLLFHFMEMLINQLVVYFILVFWFFAFLYNYFFYKKLEKHLGSKRSEDALNNK